MKELEKAKKLLADKAYKKAARLIDKLLGKDKENDELWYLRGIVALKLRDYDAAQEAFEHAIWINAKPEYWKMKGIIHMEACQMEEAIHCFQQTLRINKRDVQTLVFVSLCYMFLDDPTSQEYIRRAYISNKKKTKELLKNFYSIFFKPNTCITPSVQRALEKKLANIQI